MTDQGDTDVTRRTLLAAERTWLAWWRTGIAVTAAAVGIGSLAPSLVGGSRAPWTVLGAGYALLAIAVFVGAELRRRKVAVELARGSYSTPSGPWIAILTFGAIVLALGTLVLIVVDT